MHRDNAPEPRHRRCIGLTYHTTAFVEHPADSLLGLGESVVIYPTEGFIKTGVFLAQYESVSLGKDLLHGWQENGWQGLMSVAADHVVPVGQLVLTDPQIQNFLIAAGILELLAVAWGLDADGELLPESFFVNQDGPTSSFGQKVNNLLGYDAVQHPDHINGVILKPDDVPFEHLFKTVTVMDSNGYVGSDTMLGALLEYSPNGPQIVQQIQDVASPEIAQKISDFLAGR